MNQVLITCDADNIGSLKTIIANSGLLENVVKNKNSINIKRFWIYTVK
jgi:predicted acetyltransferase